MKKWNVISWGISITWAIFSYVFLKKTTALAFLSIFGPVVLILFLISIILSLKESEQKEILMKQSIDLLRKKNQED